MGNVTSSVGSMVRSDIVLKINDKTELTPELQSTLEAAILKDIQSRPGGKDVEKGEGMG